MMFYDVPMNQSVSTEDSRGLTSYIFPISYILEVFFYLYYLLYYLLLKIYFLVVFLREKWLIGCPGSSGGRPR
jgi:hypothetical protein